MTKWLIAGSLLIFSGCLKTRSDVKEDEQNHALQQQVQTLQHEKADQVGEMNEQIREIRGRLENVEGKVSTGNAENEKTRGNLRDQNEEHNRKQSLLQETITRLEGEVQNLNADVAALKAEVATLASREREEKSAPATVSSGDKKDGFDNGMDHVHAKEWKKAILSFQKFRDKKPKDKRNPQAAYTMGLCFQELGMKDEAKTFYDEVLAKYPDAPEAKKAKSHLKSLKK